jgi:hypothetical protein
MVYFNLDIDILYFERRRSQQVLIKEHTILQFTVSDGVYPNGSGFKFPVAIGIWQGAAGWNKLW